MGEGIEYEIVKSFVSIVGLCSVAYFVLLPVILDEARKSRARITRLDGRQKPISQRDRPPS